MTINLIMAADDNGGIGLDGKIPWRDPEDLKWFMNLTMGGIVVVGYNTAQALPELPGRIVWTMERNTTPDDILEDQAFGFFPHLKHSEQLWIAGGAKTYAQWMPYIDRFYISHIKGTFDVDTHAGFPLPWIDK